MRRNELDYVLNTLLDFNKEVSDIVFTVDKPLQVEVSGQLLPVPIQPPVERLTPFQTEMVALNLLSNSQRLTEELMRAGSCDCSYTLGDRARFRVNIFTQRGQFSIVLRKLNAQIPTLHELNLPDVIAQSAREKTGLVLVTGATGSGKSTTLASLIEQINAHAAIHVITLEDPVEFIYTQKKATINQRELGTDFDTFSTGLRAALRQAPKVILVGEMRDRATVEIALTAAETGHLVYSTIHTINAGQSINRILGLFELAEETQLRLRLSETLRYIVSQRLAPKVNGGRILINEIMGSNLRTREAIALGEDDGRSFYDIIDANATFGWTTFDQALHRAYQASLITEETANLYATNKGRMTRYIDDVKKKRGLDHEESTGLKLDLEAAMPNSYINLRVNK